MYHNSNLKIRIVPLLLRIQDRVLGIYVPQKCTPHQLSSLPLEPHHLLYRNFFQINIYFGYNFEKRVYVLTSTDFASCEKKPILFGPFSISISVYFICTKAHPFCSVLCLPQFCQCDIFEMETCVIKFLMLTY